MSYVLRPYQQRAVGKLLWAQKLEGADLCVLPTGAGKSIVIADLAHKLNQPLLILQPTKEILEQNIEKMRAYVDNNEIGIYSASMSRKYLGFYTFATIGSIYKKPETFAHFKTVIIDECHLVNPKNLDGMFTQFLQGIDNPKVIGFTATPYRLDNMYEWINGGKELVTHTVTKLINRLKERFWRRIIFNINNYELIEQGYLVPLRYVDKSIIRHSQIPTNISRSDFDMEAYEEKISGEEEKIINAIFFAQEIGKSVLVFCSSVRQAEWLADLVDGSAIVTAKTPKKERERVVEGFKSRKIQTVFNVGVFTLGFDHPTLDCIVLLRPTRSIGLYYQMLGRGVRPAEGKRFCRVVDLTGTVEALGRIETIKLVKRDQWELESEKGSWHKKPMYSFNITEKMGIDRI